jgi:hypothetical protein
MPRGGGVVGVDLQQRLALDARRLVTLTKLLLRKLRAGGEIIASG